MSGMGGYMIIKIRSRCFCIRSRWFCIRSSWFYIRLRWHYIFVGVGWFYIRWRCLMSIYCHRKLSSEKKQAINFGARSLVIFKNVFMIVVSLKVFKVKFSLQFAIFSVKVGSGFELAKPWRRILIRKYWLLLK